MDRIDPATYAPMVLREPLPNGRPKRILLQIGLGDTQVPNAGAFFHARALGIPLLQPSPLAVPGLATERDPIEGSALALYDFGIDLSVYDEATSPSVGNAVHGRLRLTEPAQRQLERFAKEGVIIHPCEGPCRVE